MVHDRSADFVWNLIIVYDDAQPDGKSAFFAELAMVCYGNTVPCLVGGDLNIIRNVNDKYKHVVMNWSFVSILFIKQNPTKYN
jgi:hypothetical protein